MSSGIDCLSIRYWKEEPLIVTIINMLQYLLIGTWRIYWWQGADKMGDYIRGILELLPLSMYCESATPAVINLCKLNKDEISRKSPREDLQEKSKGITEKHIQVTKTIRRSDMCVSCWPLCDIKNCDSYKLCTGTIKMSDTFKHSNTSHDEHTVSEKTMFMHAYMNYSLLNMELLTYTNNELLVFLSVLKPCLLLLAWENLFITCNYIRKRWGLIIPEEGLLLWSSLKPLSENHEKS